MVRRQENSPLPAYIEVADVIKHHAITLIQPVTNATKTRVRGLATQNAKWYWPPLVGKADASSARPAAALIRSKRA